MSYMIYERYLIRCLTNMHVGDGDSDFGIVDNRVQRDVITSLPIIRSTSLKGSLKHRIVGSQEDQIGIFGSSESAGLFQFFDAHLLCRPMRSTGTPFFYVFSEETVRQWNETTNRFQQDNFEYIDTKFEGSNGCVIESGTDIEIEDEKAIVSQSLFYESAKAVLKRADINNPQIAYMHDSLFQTIDLPVIARNHLEDGISKNLWYEEIVPRESVFHTTIGYPSDAEELMQAFGQKLNELKFVQIGANASVGYGYTQLTRISGGPGND